MAVSYAQMNKKVLLIDADMRNSSMKEFLQDAQWNDTDGLSEYLAEIADKPAKIAFEKNLDIIPSGTMPPNPSELLVSERWYQLLQDSQKEYDAISWISRPLVSYRMHSVWHRSQPHMYWSSERI